jgi:hypothetical protein
MGYGINIICTISILQVQQYFVRMDTIIAAACVHFYMEQITITGCNRSSAC